MIKLSSTEDRLQIVFKSQQFRLRYPRFVFVKTRRLLDEIILSEIHQKMRNLDFSKKIIDATQLDNIEISMNTGQITFDVISDYKSEDGFDVSKGREEGTKDHKLPKVEGRIYSWISKGKRFFSKGHWVRGIVANRIIRNTVRDKLPVVQKSVDNASSIFYSEITGNK